MPECIAQGLFRSQNIQGVLLTRVYNEVDQRIRTIYLSNKVYSINADVTITDSSSSRGDLLQREKRLARKAILPSSTRPFNSIYLIKKFSEVLRGSRLTLERLGQIKPSIDLTEKEASLLQEILFNRKGALTYNFTYLGRVYKDVIPP